MAQKISPLLVSIPHLVPLLCWAMKAVVPLPRHNEEVRIQPFAGLGKALNKLNLIIPRLHIVGFTSQVLEVVAPVCVVMG